MSDEKVKTIEALLLAIAERFKDSGDDLFSDERWQAITANLTVLEYLSNASQLLKETHAN